MKSDKELSSRSRLWTIPILAVAAGIVVLLVSVIPAGAGGGPASSTWGVIPAEVDLGGQPNDCQAQIPGRLPSVAQYELRINNPTDGDFTGPGNVTFTLDVHARDTMVDFSMSGATAVVFDVIIKGGSDSTHWDYDGNAGPGGVTSDTDLHAPTKGNGSKLFSVSHISFCYETDFSTLSGTVFEDVDIDGVYTVGTDVGQDGIEVVVYENGTFVQQTSSSADGSYSFALKNGLAYTACEAAQADWVQTVPTGNTDCASLGSSGQHEEAGHAGTLTSNTVADFGNAMVSCGETLTESGGVFTNASFTVFTNGNDEVACVDKIALLTVDQDEVGFVFGGSGTAAAIGIIEKQFSPPVAFEPLEYAQFDGNSFEDVPWCNLRTKQGADGNEFDPFLSDPSSYPTVTGVFDPDSGDPSVSCKVYEEEQATGEQLTIIYAADDPFYK